MKVIYTLIFLVLFQPLSLLSQDLKEFQFDGVDVTHTYEGKSLDITVKREMPSECAHLKIVKDTVFGGDLANEAVSKKCKKTFVTTIGVVQPMQIFGLKTIGEIEVLHFLEKVSDDPDKYTLVDARKVQWYLDATIPSAVNIPYTEVKYDEDVPEDFDKVLHTFNIKVIGDLKDHNYDFSEAKTAVIFCNGIWCGQSKMAIKDLLDLGYPKEKLIWYRGGVQDWYLLGFTTINGDLK